MLYVVQLFGLVLRNFVDALQFYEFPIRVFEVLSLIDQGNEKADNGVETALQHIESLTTITPTG